MNDFFATVLAGVILIPLFIGVAVLFVSIVTIAGITAHKMFRGYLSTLKKSA